MDQEEQNKTVEPTTSETPVETVAEPVMTTATDTTHTSSKKTRNTVVALLIAAMLVAGVLYVAEKQGRIDTNVFGSVSRMMHGNEAVATVNGTKITRNQLEVGMAQLNQAAALQGADTESVDVQETIRNQALDVLINTELLIQAAHNRGLSVSDDEVTDRIEQIKTEVGGEDVLHDRMKELGITDDTLKSDVKNEILIQQFLDQLFAESDISVTDEEVNTIYDSAVASGAEVPALEEVRDQVEESIRSTKQQDVIDAFITQTKASSTIDIVE
ncbi:SurA N-terminal domain-containing protein [Candidatus Kaiserbacteria bacterium]|nr:SurA N-terminal domain-containing protein [Candidatus Kaiserbacteria bacterium]